MNYIVNNDTSNNDATNINLINNIEVTHAFTRKVAVFWRLGLVFIYFRPAFSLSIISFSNRTLILPALYHFQVLGLGLAGRCGHSSAVLKKQCLVSYF